MSDTKKTITISPELFEIKKRKTKNKTVKQPKPKKIPHIKPETQLKHLRKKVLAKLKSENAAQSEMKLKTANQTQVPSSSVPVSEFSSSFQYLTDYSDRLKKQQKIDRGTLKIKPTPHSDNFNTEPTINANDKNEQLLSLSTTPLIQLDNEQLVSLNNNPSVNTNIEQPITNITNIEQPITNIEQDFDSHTDELATTNADINHFKPDPMPVDYTSQDIPWGSLKNGSKPTYRTWKNKTQKLYHEKKNMSVNKLKSEPIQTSNISQISTYNVCPNILTQSVNANINSNGTGSSSLESLKTQPIKQNQNNSIATSKKTCTTVTRKHKVGRSKNGTKISVLLKNKTLCNKLHLAKRALKQVPIVDVKLYLKRHNLIKVGGHAPHNILRNMYETALLSGDLYNKNTDILLHNFTGT
jgi:hypothetical protein